MLYLLLALLIGAPADPVPSAPAVTEPLRLAAPAFGETVEIEVRDFSREASQEAIHAALAEVAEIERLTDPDAPAEAMTGSLAALNARAGAGPSPVDARLVPALVRGIEVCFWSERVHGPLGRDLYRLWSLRAPAAVSPAEDWEALQRAVNATACRNLTVDTAAGTAELAAGSAVDLWGFAEGLAVDRAVEVLRQRGVANGFVQIGRIYRGFGKGLEDRGWHIQLPRLPGMAVPMGRVFLRDQSLAVASATDRPRTAANGDPLPPYVSQRTGRPSQGTLSAAVVTQQALDAQALAVTLAIAGPSEGQLRLGALTPRPSVLWLQGNGNGEPLAIEYLWGLVPKR
ncbi:MAG TPA: FAD:protein FMN transferase [Thermoanaerobaculia bacterium]|nr:FAD:protein FMN transferase [Thermoanaerobaculia bacterium]